MGALRIACAGIFVGGRGLRMGGAAKGLLVTEDGETILARLTRALDEVGVPAVLVGRHPAYDAVPLEIVADDPSTEGPLAGLIALLERASPDHAIALACDMPFVTAPVLRRLVDAPPAAICAPRREGKWEPFFARYDAARVLPIARARAARGERALQGLFDACDATALTLRRDLEGALADWDRPEDVTGGGDGKPPTRSD